MLQRLRLALAALVAATSLTAVTGLAAPPALADSSTGCSKISVSGSIDETTLADGAYGLRADLGGYAAANCAITQQGRDYRWKVTLSSYATGDITIYTSTIRSAPFAGYSSISFPSTSFSAPYGTGRMKIVIQTQQRSGTYGFFGNVGTAQTYSLYVPDDSFDTAGMTQTTSGDSCSIPPPVVGQKVWC